MARADSTTSPAARMAFHPRIAPGPRRAYTCANRTTATAMHLPTSAKFSRLAALPAILALAALHVHAQRVIVATQAFSAAREGAALQLHSAELGRGIVLPATEPLLGTEFHGLYLWPNGRAGLAITASGPLGGIQRPVWWRSLDPVPFKVPPAALPAAPDLAQSVLLKTWEQPGGRPWFARALDTAQGITRLYFQPWGSAASASAALTLEIPGSLVVHTAVPGPLGEVLLVVERERGRFFVISASMAAGAPEWREFELATPRNALDPRPRIMLATDQGTGYVLFGGYDLAESNAQLASWLAGFRLTGTPLGPPLQLLGAPQEQPFALAPVPGGACWCITHEPGRDVAYITLVEPGEDALAKARQYPLPGARGPVFLTARDDRDVLMAVDNRVEIWDGGVRGARARAFTAPVGALLWSSAGPVSASAAELHLLAEEDLATRSSITFQTGHIVGLREVPAWTLTAEDTDGDGLDTAAERGLGCRDDVPDTDGDGLHDGADPEPGRPTLTLDVPALVAFNGDAAGQELRALFVRPRPVAEARWQFLQNAAELPWLRLYPATSYGERPVYLGIDPAFHLDPRPLLGTVRAQPLHSLQGTADLPAREILLAVRPPRTGPARIRWMLDPATINTAPLRDALAGPPLHFSHAMAAPGTPADLFSAEIVVLGTRAAARGDVSLQALVDFVLEGGALLVVPEPAEEYARDISAWFAPLGFRLDPARALAGPFIAQGDAAPALAFPLDQKSVTGALLASVTDLPVRQTGGPGEAGPLFLRLFGLGRIAALANADLLTRDSTRFADTLFRWLSRAGLDLRDLDGDGLPDAIEDTNGNQAADPGETDWLRADSDNDGLPDGLEDRNRNGAADDGETDPRNPDSDGDGILDGADPAPCPALGAPRIAAAQPSSGPAEGGAVVLVTGANFDNTAAVYFGDQAATVRRVPGADRIEVIAPPLASNTPGPIELRIDLRGGSARATLPGGYAYTPRTRLNFTLGAAVPGWAHQQIYNGVLSISLNATGPVDAGQIVLVLEADPKEDFTFGAPRPGPALPPAARFLEHRVLGPGRLMIVFGPGAPTPFPQGEILHVPWEYGLPTPPPAGIQIAPGRTSDGAPLAAATAARGGPIDITIAPFRLDINAAGNRP